MRTTVRDDGQRIVISEKDKIRVCIGENEFDLSESFGSLVVNKVRSGSEIGGSISIKPMYSNEIEVS